MTATFRRGAVAWAVALFVLSSHATIMTAAFSSCSLSICCRKSLNSQDAKSKDSALTMANVFDDLMSFFDAGGNGNNEDALPAGQSRILTIPVESIKPGGLRLFLMFYLMGQQNTPDPGSWQASQPTREEYVVDFWYHDQSAVLTVTLSEEDKEITIDRVGSKPSTSYMMQESMVLQGILDELEQMASDERITVENRLLTVRPAPNNAIDQARESLAFG